MPLFKSNNFSGSTTMDITGKSYFLPIKYDFVTTSLSILFHTVLALTTKPLRTFPFGFSHSGDVLMYSIPFFEVISLISIGLLYKYVFFSQGVGSEPSNV
ncbi:hypothetical protein JCM30566_11390 [Marinitoga arctica]